MTDFDRLPDTLTDAELMRVLNVSKRTFYRHKAQGKFRRFELPRPIDARRYSARRVAAYVGASVSR